MIYNNKILRINKHLEVEVQTSVELSESILVSLNDNKSAVYSFELLQLLRLKR